MDLRDFRSHDRKSLQIGESLTVIAGPNGSGKTNLLEALHFGLTGRSCRTAMDRQAIRWDTQTAFVEINWSDDGVPHNLKTALDRSGEKRIRLNDSPLEQALPSTKRPAVIVFLPDRLSLISGAPGERRKHFDRLITEVNSSYGQLRSRYTEALVQRNALLGTMRGGGQPPASLDAWNKTLSEVGAEVVARRDEVTARINSELGQTASILGLQGYLDLRHRPGASSSVDEYMAELEERTAGDVDRGFTSYGPHRADFVFWREGHDIKTTGSQGEKRMSLLALLLTERRLLTERTGSTPVLLMDDVMSELDAKRRRLLVEHVSRQGQCVITATEFEHVPVEGVTGVVTIPIGDNPEPDLRVA
jgi:DNA replication and repair protein RecF